MFNLKSIFFKYFDNINKIKQVFKNANDIRDDVLADKKISIKSHHLLINNVKLARKIPLVRTEIYMLFNNLYLTSLCVNKDITLRDLFVEKMKNSDFDAKCRYFCLKYSIKLASIYILLIIIILLLGIKLLTSLL